MSENDNVIGPRVRAVENMVARAREKTQSSSGGPACVNCRVTMWMSFFFDGTNNHRDRDFPRDHSNVAALFDAHLDSPESAVHRRYYEGVGTTFEFEDRHERVVLSHRDGTFHDRNGYREGESKVRQGFGGGLDIRLEKAIFEFQMAVERQKGLTRVDEINIAAFGFSRGATSARAFVNWLAQHSKVTLEGSRLRYDGVPLNVKFLGLFDTVESMGGAGTNRQPHLVKTSVPTYVQRCLHIVAAHELRRAFPVTVLGTDRYTQVVYPGAHADTGGGYLDGAQGRSNQLARVAMLQMLDHARGAGLKMLSVNEMRGSEGWGDVFSHSFDVPASATQALSAYMAHVTTQAGLLRTVLEAHMRLYWAWIDAGLALEDANAKREALPGGRRNRPAAGSGQFRTMAHLYRSLARTPAGRGVGNVPPVRNVVPAAVEDFFETYVHDSFEHFSMTGGTLQADVTVADYYELRETHAPRA